MIDASIAQPKLPLPWRDAKGHNDLTGYLAVKNIEKAEFADRSLVYICSPFSGDIEANTAMARRFCRVAVGRRVVPLAPHLLFPQFMDDGDLDERETAMWFNRMLLARCDGLWVYAPQISAGMRVEIGWACKQEIPVSFFDENFQEISYEL